MYEPVASNARIIRWSDRSVGIQTQLRLAVSTSQAQSLVLQAIHSILVDLYIPSKRRLISPFKKIDIHKLGEIIVSVHPMRQEDGHFIAELTGPKTHPVVPSIEQFKF